MAESGDSNMPAKEEEVEESQEFLAFEDEGEEDGDLEVCGLMLIALQIINAN